MVEMNLATVIDHEAPCGEFDLRDFSTNKFHLSKSSTHRERDVIFRQASCRNLIEQRCEEVIRIPINESHSMGRRTPKLFCTCQPTKASTHDDHMLFWWGLAPLERHAANLRRGALVVGFRG